MPRYANPSSTPSNRYGPPQKGETHQPPAMPPAEEGDLDEAVRGNRAHLGRSYSSGCSSWRAIQNAPGELKNRRSPPLRSMRARRCRSRFAGSPAFLEFACMHPSPSPAPSPLHAALADRSPKSPPAAATAGSGNGLRHASTFELALGTHRSPVLHLIVAFLDAMLR